jgi:hypothetical protein
VNDYSYFFENSQLLNLFVSAFDDVFVYRYDAKTKDDKEKIEVRYVHGPKHRVLHDLSDRAKTLTLPVVTIEQTSLSRDASRIQNKDQFLYRKQLNSDNSLVKIPTPIPVNLELSVNIICYFKEDLEQIIQNFVVNCNPYIIVSWKFPEKFGLPFLDEIRSEIQWSGNINYSNPKDLSPDVKWRISAETSFTIKGWLFKNYDNPKQSPIYRVNADFHALPVSKRFCDYNVFDSISAIGVQTESLSVGAYPELTNYFVNGNPRQGSLVVSDLNEKFFAFYGKNLNYNNTWYLSSNAPIQELNYVEINTAKSPTISAYQLPDDVITTIDNNIASISFDVDYFGNFNGDAVFITANDVAWAISY